MKDSRYDETKETESGDTLPGKLPVLCVLCVPSIFLFVPSLNELPDVFKQPAHVTEQWQNQ
jgi:hypothetical protein